MKQLLPRTKRASSLAQPSHGGFSLVEVTVALGLVSYSLLALLGLFVVSMNSIRDSAMETAMAQIVTHASSNYTTSQTSGTLAYTYSGAPLDASAPALEKHFNVNVLAESSDQTIIANTPTNLKFITITITSMDRPGQAYIVHTTELLP